MASKKPDPRITKRRVTMTNRIANADDTVTKEQAVDFVPPEFLDAYVADARTKWQTVDVSDEPDAGPGGYDGDTHHPEHLRG